MRRRRARTSFAQATAGPMPPRLEHLRHRTSEGTRHMTLARNSVTRARAMIIEHANRYLETPSPAATTLYHIFHDLFEFADAEKINLDEIIAEAKRDFQATTKPLTSTLSHFPAPTPYPCPYATAGAFSHRKPVSQVSSFKFRQPLTSTFFHPQNRRPTQPTKPPPLLKPPKPAKGSIGFSRREGFATFGAP